MGALYWVLSFASMLTPFVFFSAALVFEKTRNPDAFQAFRAGAADNLATFPIATQILLVVGFGCSIGLALNILKMKKFEKKGMLEYLAFLTSGIPLAVIMFFLIKMR
jgi:hypothetical protein